MDLQGRVVAITGGARGIGAATAQALAAAGATVAIGDRDLPLAEQTAQSMGALALPLDVTDSGSVAAFLDEVEQQLGPVDVYVNNAGIMPLSTLLEEDAATTERVFAVNTLAMIAGTREAARRMVPRGRGHIVNVASTAGKAGLAGASTYGASKAAVIVFSEAAEQELAEHGLAVSVVMPGIVRTELAAGVPDLPGLAAITPQAVAEGILEAIREPRLEVYVPKSAGTMMTLAMLMPKRAGRWLSRRMGADTVFLDALHAPEREGYEARVSR